MATSSEKSAAEEHLLTVLAMVNDWLKFAEAKNGGMIALGGLSLTGLLSWVPSVKGFPLGAVPVLAFGTSLWICSICFAIFSFKPQTSLHRHSRESQRLPEDEDNLFYFGHLANYDSKDLLQDLGLDTTTPGVRERFERSLADQVINNSRITMFKLNRFDDAMHWWIAGLLIVAAGVFWTFYGGK